MEGWQRFYNMDNVTMGNYTIWDVIESSANVSGWRQHSEDMDNEDDKDVVVIHDNAISERIMVEG